MKKSLIALAALAVVSAASAQSSLQLTGTFSPNYNSAKTTTGSGASRTANTFENSNIATSRVLFKGTEDLGGGNKAIFLYEMDFDTTTTKATTLAGEVYVGVTGALGSVKVGAPNSPTLSTQSGRAGGFTSKIGGGRGGFALSGLSVTRQSNAVRYDTPTVAGFSAAVNYTPQLSAASNAQGVATGSLANAITDFGVFYKNGPIDAGISNYAQSAVTSQTTAFASYTMGAAQVTLGMHTRDNKKAVADAESSAAVKATSDGATAAVASLGSVFGDPIGKSSGYNVALEYSLSPAVSVFGNIARTNDKTTVNRDLSMTAVGVSYDLSKRTSLHARYISEKRDNMSATTTMLAKQTTTILGLVHNF